MSEIPSGQDRANFVEYLHETEIECAALTDNAMRDSQDESTWLRIKEWCRGIGLLLTTIASICTASALGWYISPVLSSGNWQDRWIVFSFGALVTVLIVVKQVAKATDLTDARLNIKNLKAWSSDYNILVDRCKKERHMRASAATSRGELDESADMIEREKQAIDRYYHPDPDDLARSRKRVRKDMQENDYDPIKTLRVEEVRGISNDVEEFNRKLAEAEALAEAEQGLDNKQSNA